LLSEFSNTLNEANQTIKPLLQKAKSQGFTQAFISYLELKYGVMMSYCTFLSFYLLMKVEGKDVTEHPVLFKLTATKGLLDQLKPLDAKLEIQIKKHKRGNTAL
jgi:hypothetical protein